MSDIYLKKPNDKWVLYSTVIESIVLDDVERNELIKYKINKYRQRLNKKLDEIEAEGGDWYIPPINYEGLKRREEIAGIGTND